MNTYIKYSQEGKFIEGLQKGDLILVTYRGHMTPAIFKGSGPAGNPQFYVISPYVNRFITKDIKPYVDFINRGYEDNIAKIRVEDVSQEIRDLYNKYYSFLKGKKAI